MQHVVKSGDVKLVKELLSDGFSINHNTALLVGTLGKNEMIDFIFMNGNYLVKNKILNGLAFASRNDLLQQYDEEYDQGPDSAAYFSAVRGGNNILVKKWYNPRRREETLSNAASGNNLELINWISNTSPLDKNDHFNIIMGALYGGNFSLLERYSDNEIMEILYKDEKITNDSTLILLDTDKKVIGEETIKIFVDTDEKIIDNAVLGNNPLIFERIITIFSQGNQTKKNFLVDKAFKKAPPYRKYQILKYLLSTQYEGIAIREVYELILSRDRFHYLRSYIHKSQDAKIYLSFDEIIVLAKRGGLDINELIKCYQYPWKTVLTSAIMDDDINIARWIIETFQPDDSILREYKDYKGCTAHWIKNLIQ